jgi:hypothetical protein
MATMSTKAVATMTDPIQPRRTPSAPRSNRAGAAQGSKIAVAGFGLATMFGLVGLMGYANKTTVVTPAPAPAAAVPPQVVVVIHAADGQAAAAAPSAATTGSVPTASPSQPVVLTAQPIVRQAPASPAPAAQTNGSR